MPIPRASDAIAVGNDDRVLCSPGASRSIVTDSGQLLYDFCSRAIENWPMACNAPRRLEFALVSQRFSSGDAIGGPSILYPSPGPRVARAAARSFSLIEPSCSRPVSCALPAGSHALALGPQAGEENPLVRRLASSGESPYDVGSWQDRRVFSLSQTTYQRPSSAQTPFGASGWMTLILVDGCPSEVPSQCEERV